MDLRKIKKLIELVEESGIDELEVRDGEEAIRIARRSQAPAAAVVAAPHTEPQPERRQPPAPALGESVDAPCAGTFYVAPAPGEPPFVNVGDTVAVGDVLCIIESMKMMNQIEADRAGVVAAVLVENGRPVETGTPLFRIG